MPVSLTERREVLEDLNRLAVADIVDLWRDASGLDLSSPQFRQVMIDNVPELIVPSMATAADHAATWYEDSAPELSFTASPAALAPAEQLSASTAWALYSSGDAALSLMAGFTERAIFGAARDTITENVSRERGSTWARHASANACGFCRMLATRGAVYASEAAATSVVGRGQAMTPAERRARARGDVRGPRGRVMAGGVRSRGSRPLGERFHDNCRCMAVEVRPGHSYEPPPYVEQWEQDYRAATRETAKTGEHGAIDPNAVAAHMDASERARRRAASAPTSAPAVRAGTGGRKPPTPPPTGRQGLAVPGPEDLPPLRSRAETGAPFFVIDEQARRHILDGEPDDAKKGGHRFGTGRPNKTEFPQDWDDDRIIAAVEATIEEHHSVIASGDSTIRRRVIDDVMITVRSFEKNGSTVFVHAYPVGGRGVVRNDPATGERVPVPLDLERLYRP